MRQIDSYVDEVYHNVGGSKKEIEELKEEMKIHLLEAVHELKAEGKSEQEAIEMAINRFGGEQEIRSVVGHIFRAQKTFAKSILIIAVSILVFSLALFGFIVIFEEQNSRETSLIGTEIAGLLEGKDGISKEMEEKIQNLVQGTDQISKVSIFNISDVKRDFGSNIKTFEYTRVANPTFTYERPVWAPEWLYNYGPYEKVYEEWYLAMEFKRIGSVVAYISLAGATIYLVLFTIWATINAYHHRRINIGWILVFTLFNILGYLIYYIVGKKAVK